MSDARWPGQRPAELVPDTAPFDEEQRAWLNGFLAGLLGLGGGAPAPAGAPLPAAEPPGAPGGPVAARALGQLLGAAPASELNGHAAEPVSGVRGVVASEAAVEAARAVSSRAARRRLVGDGRAPDEPQRLRVKSQRKLTQADAGSEILEIILAVDDAPLRWEPGDCLAVFPHNDPDLVRALLRALGARGQELVSTPNGPTEAWRCLLEDLDVTHVRDETLRLFAGEGRADEARALCESLSGASPSGFDLLDLIGMFPGARPGLERLVATLGPLTPRVYAISSSPAAHPGELHLAVRVVRAERAGRERKGVASQYLSEGVFSGGDVSARLQRAERFVLPSEASRPLIMLGAGTGLARFRAFLQELELRGRRGGTWLVAASACEGDEALFEAELEAWARCGVLEHLDRIKLGPRGRRIGIEDVLRKRARRVVSWVDRGAFVYACGESKALSAGLGDTLIDVLGRPGKMSHAEAAELLHVMRREGRYVEEVC